MITGIEHFGVYCKDTKAVAQWYCDTFGMEIALDTGRGIYFIKAPDGSMLEICPMDEALEPQGRATQGLRHIALSIEPQDYEMMTQRIRDQGLEILAETPEGANPRTFFFRDIEGNIVHFIYRDKPL